MKTLLSLTGVFAFGATPIGTLLNNTNNINETEKSVLVGYWHNFDNAQSAQWTQEFAKYINLTDVPTEYNFVNISFMRSEQVGVLPDFTPLVASHPEMTQEQKNAFFVKEIDILHSRGQKVILSLGGADAHVDLKTADTQNFIDKIIELTDKYDFDGLDIDLEQAAINASDNEIVIPNALKYVKNYYQAQGKHFYITMAPEFPYLKTNAAFGDYIKYLESLEGYYDWINPQFYNQAGDGVNVQDEDRAELNLNLYWLAQNNVEYKAEFLYLISKYIVEGKDNFYQIDADKLVMGLPSNIDAANNGQVQTGDIAKATNYLKAKNIFVKGLMTWSVNWDKNTNYWFRDIYLNEFYQ
ncbi:glycosyl hydrolase family 18 protein [Spiroplasma chrysopicola]|uniref:chitinase n=1 Tax=Spiroplasma chrysopicola DF-1 TaxID=1276227 RepID=R4UAX3_9MOLU|nr:glycosyl hydrolase family 18 protein [Spiroplasma chrysopicola]AGM25054.1 chitinase [Spiroplasma chrysopicola DF-1]